MKLNSVEKKEHSIVELEITVEKEVFAKAVDEAFAKNVADITVPGFRKGKAPRKIIEQRYGKGMFYEEAINATYPEAYDAAVKEAGIEAVAPGEVELVNVDDDGYTFKAMVPVRPEVTLGEYKGIEVTKKAAKVTAAMVNQELERKRQNQSRFVTVEDRASKKGDTAVIDFEGFADGVAFPGGKGEGYDLELGSNSFIPGFEDQLIGKNAGEEVDVNVTFPEEYHEASLAGKPALFKVKIHEIKVKEVPELNDDFAKDVSEFDTLKELKADIKKSLTEQAKEQVQHALENSVIDKLVEGMSADIPEAMINQQIDNQVNEMEGTLRQQGLDFDTYLKYVGSTREQYRETMKEGAEKSVKARLALEEIVKLEKIAVSEEELDDEYKRYADMYQVELEQVKQFIPAESLSQDLAISKAVQFVVSKANVKEEEKKTTKKTAEKETEEEAK